MSGGDQGSAIAAAGDVHRTYGQYQGNLKVEWISMFLE